MAEKPVVSVSPRCVLSLSLSFEDLRCSVKVINLEVLSCPQRAESFPVFFPFQPKVESIFYSKPDCVGQYSTTQLLYVVSKKS